MDGLTKKLKKTAKEEEKDKGDQEEKDTFEDERKESKL